jgi:hypothetical protein
MVEDHISPSQEKPPSDSQANPWQGLQARASVIAAVGGLIAGIAAFHAELRDIVTEIWKFSPALLGSVVLLITIVVFVASKRLLARKSYLVEPQKLDLRGELVGRDEDTRRLLRLAAEFPLIWLVGESGSGKSSILKLAVLPGLAADRAIFPLYVNTWGVDWEVGPREALVDSLTRLLSADGLDIGRQYLPLASQNVFTVLRSIRAKHGKRPILIFDQLDDYVTRHKHRFLSAHDRTVISTDHLIEQNAFWRDVRDFIVNDGAHCLLAMRSDATYALESFRFASPQSYALFGLERGYALPLLDRLISNSVRNPSHGFASLKRRLVNDLESHGSVLPIQMALAYRGLAGLRYLTDTEYEKVGGLVGLEAQYIQQRLSNACLNSRLTFTDLKSALLLMIDRTSGNDLVKTIFRTTQEISAALAPEDVERQHSLTIALEALESAGILRRRNDPDTGNESWALFHDYLSNGLLELDRRSKDWQRLLSQAARAFEQSGDVRGRWVSLLGPGTQIRLVVQRLRGGLVYGEATKFALISTVKLGLNLWILSVALLCSGVFFWQAERANQQGSKIFASIGLDNASSALSKEEAEALWDLAEASYSVRRGLLNNALEFPANAERFNRRQKEVLQAVIGLNSTLRPRLISDVIKPRCYLYAIRSFNDPIAQACGFLIQTLDEGSESGAQYFLREVEAIQPLGDRADAAIDLGEHCARAGCEAALKALNIIKNDIETAPNEAMRGQDLELAIVACARALRPTDLPLAAAALEEAIARVSEGEKLQALGQALGVVAGKMRQEDAAVAARHMLDAMKKAIGAEYPSYPVGLISQALGKLGPAVPSDVATEAGQILTREIAKESDVDGLEKLGVGLGSLKHNVSSAALETAANSFITCMSRTNSSVELKYLDSESRYLIDGITPFADSLSAEQAARIEGLELSAISRLPKVDQGLDLENLSRELGVFNAQLTEQSALVVGPMITEAMRTSQDEDLLLAYAVTFAPLAGKSTLADASYVQDRLIPILGNETSIYTINTVSQMLSTFHERLSELSTKAVVEKLLFAIESSGPPQFPLEPGKSFTKPQVSLINTLQNFSSSLS